MLNPKETLKSIKALLSSEEAPKVEEIATEEVALEEVKEEVAEVALEDAPAEDAPAEEEAPKDDFVSISVFEEAIAMLVSEIEALKGTEEASKEDEMTEEVKEELSAEVVAEEETTELSVHNPEVQQVKFNSNKPTNRKQAIWNIINNI